MPETSENIEEPNENYFEYILKGNFPIYDPFGNTDGENMESFMNLRAPREFNGALTNFASFDNNEINIVTYKDGM